MKSLVIRAAIFVLTAYVPVWGVEPTGKLDFTSVHVGEAAQRTLVVPNTTNTPVTVREVNASCSCVRILSVSRTIAANSTGKLTLEYRPVRPGKTEIEVLVAMDPDSIPVVEFRWVGEILPMNVGIPAKAQSPAIDTFISAQALAVATTKSGCILFDIRDPAQFQLGSIEGAANWPVSMLKTFASLKLRPIVLTGSGSNDAMVVQAAQELRDVGFESVKVLRGGTRGWFAARQHGGNMSMALVSSTEFLGSSQDEWLVIQLSANLPGPATIPGAVKIALGPAFASSLAEALRRAAIDRPSVSKALVASEDGAGYEALESSLPKDLAIPLFYLKGGSQGYRATMNQNQAQGSQRTVKISAAGFVPGTQETRIFSPAGCGTCPPKR